MVKKAADGKLFCTAGKNPASKTVIETATKDDRCWNCEKCKEFGIKNPNLKPGVGPPHWRGIASAGTGTDVRDFAKG